MGALTVEGFEPRIVFTAPWEPVLVRRGDALGIRALTDVIAEAVAPGLSSRINDARWITILAWSLARSHDAFFASGGRSVSTRIEQRARYAWLRPLELMWVARTMEVAGESFANRLLPGRRRVRAWREHDNEASPHFGMTEDQFRNYRQTGIYGAYRLGFRKWPEMTVLGDGWTPGPASHRLARWLDKNLGAARPAFPLFTSANNGEGLSSRSAKRARGDEVSFWLRTWPEYKNGGRSADENTLPRPRDDFEVVHEAEVLTAPLFGDHAGGKRRMQIARAIEVANCSDHAEVCAALREEFGGDRAINLLPAFSRLADAGMAAMELVARVLKKQLFVALGEVVRDPKAKDVCAELSASAKAWLAAARASQGVRHIDAANRFASAVATANRLECLRELLLHHELRGAGLRWFVLRGGNVEARSPAALGSARYRFRLWSLCRLAAQVGVIDGMPSGLEADDYELADDDEELVDEEGDS